MNNIEFTSNVFGPKMPDLGIMHEGKKVRHAVSADEVRNEKRYLIEVDVTPSNGTVIGSGGHVHQGKQLALIWKSELPAIQTLVQTDEHKAAWNVAVQTYKRMEKTYIEKNLAKDERENQAEVAKVLSNFYEHPAIEFAKVFPEGLPPLASLEIVKEVDAPNTKESHTENVLEKLISSLQPQQSTDKVAALENQVAQLMAAIEKLSAEKKK